MKKYLYSLLLASFCLLSCCCPDEEENTADVMFLWLGSSDFLSVTEPIMTWTAFGATPHSVKEVSRKIDLHFEDFDSLLVMANVTYPSLEQLPDTIGKVYYMGRILTGSIVVTYENGIINQSKAAEHFSVDTIHGGQLENYVQSLNGTIDNYGYVVYRDGSYRLKERWEELKWINAK